MNITKEHKESIKALYGEDQKAAKQAIKQLDYVSESKRNQIFNSEGKVILTLEELSEFTKKTEWQVMIDQLSDEDLDFLQLYASRKLKKLLKEQDKAQAKRKKASNL